MHTGATSNWLNLQQPKPGERRLKSIHSVFKGPPGLLNQPRVDQEVIAIATGKARGLIYNGHKEYCKCILVSYAITLTLQMLTCNTSGPSCSPLVCQCKVELCAQGCSTGCYCQIVGFTYQSVLEQDTQPKTALSGSFAHFLKEKIKLNDKHTVAAAKLPQRTHLVGES